MASTTKKTTAKVIKTDNSGQVKKLEAELAATKEQNNKIMSTLDALLNKISELEASKDSNSNSSSETLTVSQEKEDVSHETIQETPIKKNLRRDYVTIVHLLENHPDISTHIELTGCTIDFHTLGEERTLSWQQFEELAGKFKRLFDIDVIALSEEDGDLVSRYNLKTTQDTILNRFYLENLPNMKTEDLESFYNKLSKTHKSFILGYWQRKFLEGDVRFKDRRKIELLNSLSNEAMNNIIIELNEEKKRKK